MKDDQSKRIADLESEIEDLRETLDRTRDRLREERRDTKAIVIDLQCQIAAVNARLALHGRAAAATEKRRARAADAMREAALRMQYRIEALESRLTLLGHDGRGSATIEERLAKLETELAKETEFTNQLSVFGCDPCRKIEAKENERLLRR